MDDVIEFMNCFIDGLSDIKNDDYKINRFNVYEQYMREAEVPVSLMYRIIDRPYKSLWEKQQVKEFMEYINSGIWYEFNYIYNFNSYVNTDEFSTYIIQSYLRNYLQDINAYRKSIIYINTPLYLVDNKRLIGKDSALAKSLIYSKDTLCHGVENADLIIWDKFTELVSEYDRTEIYNTLMIRHKRGLSNLFLISGGVNGIKGKLSSQIIDMIGRDIIEVKES